MDVTTAVWSVIGVVVLALGAADIFLAVLHYDGSPPLARRFHHVVWRGIRAATRLVPFRWRGDARCLASPLLIPATLAFWIGAQILGFALVYYPALQRGGFTLPPGDLPNMWDAVYVSAVTQSTLGYGDITPAITPYRLIASLQALIGFTLITLGVAYVINVYQVLRELSVLGAELQPEPNASGPESLLGAHFIDGEPRDLGTRLQGFHHQLLRYYEGLRRYPVVYYIHSRDRDRSLRHVISRLADLVAALRWASPPGHPVACEPYLRALAATIAKVTAGIPQQVRELRQAPHPGPVPRSEFTAACRREIAADEWVVRYLSTARRMQELTGSASTDLEGRYEDYRAWLRFLATADAFALEVGRHLAYDPELIAERQP